MLAARMRCLVEILRLWHFIDIIAHINQVTLGLLKAALAQISLGSYEGTSVCLRVDDKVVEFKLSVTDDREAGVTQYTPKIARRLQNGLRNLDTGVELS